MAIWRRKTTVPADAEGIVATVRLVRRDSDIPSLRDGEVALVDLPDIDAQQAQALIDTHVRAVLNASRSSTGRVPNVGPQMLVRAGIVLVDITSDDVSSRLKSGERLRVHGGQVHRDATVVASGVEIDADRATADLAAASDTMATRLDSLAANATDHLHREHAMLVGGALVPRLRTQMDDRPVVVVSHAFDDAADLAGLRRWINDSDPVLIGAGPGADVLLAAGHVPTVVIGSLDNLSDAAIKAAEEVVVTTASGILDMPERLERHGKEVTTFVSSGADDDLAIILADSHRAGVIVHVGAPPTLTDFLDRAPSDAARMFVARLRAGARIVDAKAVHHFTSQRLSLWPVALLLAAGVAAVAVAISVTPVGQDWYDSLGGQLSDLGSWIKGLFS